MDFLLYLVIATACAVYCRRTAKANGGSPTAWLVIGFLFTVPAAFYAFLSSRSTEHLCPGCEAPYVAGAAKCPSCGYSLPDRYALENLIDPSVEYDNVCPACATPYRRGDYRHDALEIRCSRCSEPLPIS